MRIMHYALCNIAQKLIPHIPWQNCSSQQISSQNMLLLKPSSSHYQRMVINLSLLTAQESLKRFTTYLNVQFQMSLSFPRQLFGLLKAVSCFAFVSIIILSKIILKVRVFFLGQTHSILFIVCVLCSRSKTVICDILRDISGKVMFL